MKGTSVLSNSLFHAGMRAMASATALGLTWLIANRAAADLGIFRTLLVFFVICEFIPLLGMHAYLFREVSLHPHHIKKYALHAFLLAIVVSLAAVLGLISLAHFGQYSAGISNGLMILSGALPATAASLCAQSILVGLSQGAKLGLIQGVETLVRTAFGVISILQGWSILVVIAGFVVCRWLILFWYWRELAPQAREEKWSLDRAFFLHFLSHIPTFAGITLLALVARNAAQLMLPWMKTDEEAGRFGAAFLFIDLVLLVPVSLITNLVPHFSAHARESWDAVRQPCQQAVKMMALGVLPAVALVSLHAGDLAGLLFHTKADYLATVPVLQIAIWIAFVGALDQVFALAMLACGKQSMDLKTLVVGSTVTVAALYYFISAYGALGAAIGMLVGTVANVLTRMALLSRIIPGINIPALLWRPALACAVALGLASSLPKTTWVLNAAVAGILYLGGLALLGAFQKKERDDLLMLLGSRSKASAG